MKKFALCFAFLCVLGFGVPSLAADAFLDQGLPRMQKELGLSADQVQKITTAYNTFKVAIKDYEGKTSLTPQELTDLQSKQRNFEGQITQIFTPEQHLKLDALRKKELDSRQKQMHEVLLTQLEKSLTLTGKQKTKIDKILTDFEKQVMPIIVKNNPTQENLQKINVMKEKRDAKIESVLTDKQKKQFRELKAQATQQAQGAAQ